MVWLALSVALGRPYTSVGFTASDVVESEDSPTGEVRVHFSVDGPSSTLLADQDADGVLDFPHDALLVAEESILLFEALGLSPLLREADFGLDLGGSPAIDVYMIDFQQGADGNWGTDACDAAGCVGYLRIDHRFGNYPAPIVGVETVVPHELFHGVQAAYAPDWPIWFSEGTATWSERQFVDDSFDFIGFANRYLEDVGRPVDRPPTGPVPAFAYGTAIFFDFLTLRHDADLMHEILTLGAVEVQADPDADLMPVIDAALQARGDDLESAFIDFARYNLATGQRSGGIDSYPYASRLNAPTPEARGAFLDEEPRYFQYAMVFHRLDHDGGPMALWWEEDAADVTLELFPTDANVIQPSIWSGSISNTVEDFGDQPEGTYWLMGVISVPVEQSIRVRMCLGATSDVEACADPGDPMDTGPVDEEPKGCACANGSTGAGWLVPMLGVLALRRRR